jgi:3-phenylpropionate/cinnamic acid dioxygenase small subunit
MSSFRLEIAALVAESALALDEGDFARFLALTAPGFRYRVLVASAELRREVAWLDQTREGLIALFSTLNEHLLRPGRLHRFAVPARIEPSGAGWRVTSTLLVHTTDPHGVTKPLAVGRYEDTVIEENGVLRLAARDVRLDTRDIGIGSHVPF